MMECPESRDQQQQHMTPWARGIRIKNKLLISVDDIFYSVSSKETMQM